MGNFTIRHTFDVDVDTYWDKIFFDEELHRRMYVGELGFVAYDVLEMDRREDGVITRKLKTEPKSDAPAVVKKLVGDSLSYTEDGRFDPTRKRWVYTITTSKLPDKVSISGEFWLEPRGNKRSERLCTVDVRVKIFGVGKVVEAFIEKSTRDSYEKATALIRRHIAEQGL